MGLPTFSGARHGRRCRPFALTAGLLLCVHALAGAQEPSNLTLRVPPQATEASPLLISADLFSAETLDKIFLLYRTADRSEYTRLEMDLRGGSATVMLPASAVVAPYLEYYLVLQHRDGLLETHPVSQTGDPFGSPPPNVLRLLVRPNGGAEIPVLMLSPDPLTPAEPEELVLSVSLLRTDSTVDRRATRLLVDGADVTADAVTSDDMLIYVPANFGRTLSPGSHQFTILLFDTDGAIAGSVTRPFLVGGAPGEPVAPELPLRYGVTAQFESRNEQIGGDANWYNRGGAQFSGMVDIWTVRASLFLTSDERSERQPQHRYFIGGSTPWVSVGYGDAYPNFSDLILNGKRVRGLHSSINLGDFHVELATGQTDRAIDGRLVAVYGADTIGLVQQRTPDAAYAPIDASTWGRFSYGTYARNLFALRPWFGSAGNWHVAFTVLKAKDDDESIRFGIRPQENLVVGTDFVARFFDNIFEVGGQAAFSAYNSDISSGTFTDAYIDSVYPNDASTVKSVRDILDGFITVNDNLRPLSVSTPATLSWDTWFGIRAFDNDLRFRSLYRGSDYTSFGQTFLRRDIEGFSLTDLVRLVGNQVFLNLGYERLQDNTANTKPATTTYTTLNTAVSYYPRMDMPSVTVGLAFTSNDNSLAPDSAFAVDEGGHRFFIQSSYAFRAGAEHTATASFSTSARDDETRRNADVSDIALTLGLATRFAFPLTATFDLAFNRNEYPAGTSGTVTFGYTTLSFGGRYTAVPEVLLVRGTLSPTMGDLRRTIIAAGADWTVNKPLTVMLDASHFLQDGLPDDAIWSLRLRYDL